ncbi:MAG: hypothetical protein HY474_02190 [Candidatus Sungbacteria bacterium]|uniref:CMP/dCMP-type deaminase domain-containing protein n=1 Tax=Candidatus Sungiibacteriota bacterium TaxID=2750080 RepID=A0A933DT86_9BACT|nr:hypothetical protein [Candidatus Sungbacteria bacterium]
MLKSTDTAELLQTLRATLDRSVLKKSRNDREANSASCAISRSGGRYGGARVESDTNLLDMSSEHIALLRAVQQRDFDIVEVVTLVDADSGIVSPLVIKILTDFGARTGAMPAYRMLNAQGNILFETDDVSKELPFYRPVLQRFSAVNDTPQKNWDASGHSEKLDDLLKTHALRGLTLAFPTYEGASSYGAAVRAASGTVYFGGQYSAPEKRLNIHAEMSAILAALMEGETVVTHIGLVSDKFVSEPCSLCGCCRQFILELSRKFDWDARISCFAKEAPIQATYSIGDLLPHSWNSKQWQ